MEPKTILTWVAASGSFAVSWFGGLRGVFNNLALDTLVLNLSDSDYTCPIEHIFPRAIKRLNSGELFIGESNGIYVKESSLIMGSEKSISWTSKIGKVPIFLTHLTETPDNNNQELLKISFPRGFLSKGEVAKFIVERAESYKPVIYGCTMCYGNDTNKLVYPPLEQRLLDNVCRHKVTKKESPWIWNTEVNSLLEFIDKFITSRNWYIDKGIPWKLGIMLYGAPGNGKSALINYVANKYCYDIADLTVNKENKLDRDCNGGLLRIEDYDSIFLGRKNMSKKIKGDFSELLKLLDETLGLIFITTNNLDSIDGAIGIPDKTGKSSRPGRIHRVIHMVNPEEEVRSKIAKRMLPVDYDITAIVEAGKDETYAQFSDRCSTLALELFWNERN